MECKMTRRASRALVRSTVRSKRKLSRCEEGFEVMVAMNELFGEHALAVTEEKEPR